MTEHKPHSIRHARTEPVTVEALLAEDYELQLMWAPMSAWLEAPGCRNGACESEEACTCGR